MHADFAEALGAICATACGSGHGQLQRGGIDQLVLADHRGPAHAIEEFANVARPRMIVQCASGRSIEAAGTHPVLVAEPGQAVAGEQFHVVATFAQARHVQA